MTCCCFHKFSTRAGNGFSTGFTDQDKYHVSTCPFYIHAPSVHHRINRKCAQKFHLCQQTTFAMKFQTARSSSKCGNRSSHCWGHRSLQPSLAHSPLITPHRQQSLLPLPLLRAGETAFNTAPISSLSPADSSLTYEGSLCLFCLCRRRARARTRAVLLCAHAEGRPDVPLPVSSYVGILTMPYSSYHATTL